MFYNNRGFYPSTLGNFSTPKPKINWGNILNNTQKTLGIINQSIPIFYQIKPIWNNAKTMFKVMGELKEKPSSINNDQKKEVANTPQQSIVNDTPTHYDTDSNPQFFL